MKEPASLHEWAALVEKSNSWPWEMCLGYCSGKDDARAHRKPEHSLKECDDYALGYHKGYAEVTG